mmetsp:Transcript_12851/g.24414  ORF Transcript_12851/g.24414 Transcript_12851/m.24414 type:complete len:518 (-) Transcript_12851:198-1751(-)|eukprot:CAMPEP_0114232812 /NCGR_PEP_ID=MMETSP0058-20121206/4818_1 /TAXON_ID=36894 /ORGANISM="Pyramimonas parkeae, CCMP726" /LENGTH=517 /DNA_ID=CAMNT_0001344335 /DNA_START=223 /DNA_END=1776 /DNA_ORIENTATION=+
MNGQTASTRNAELDASSSTACDLTNRMPERTGPVSCSSGAPPTPPASVASVGIRLPGFESEPIRWTREYWVTRRVLRAIWLLVLTSSLLGLIMAGVLMGQGHLELRNFQLHRFAFLAGGFFTFLAVPISIFGIFQHLENNSKPHLQRHIVRILWMVPIYALDSWLALLLGVMCQQESTIYFDTLRECYEAFTIYSFYCFTVAAMHDLKGIPLAQVLKDKPPMKHWFPLRVVVGQREFEVVSPWEMGPPFVSQCSWGILNYVVMKPLMTALTLVLQVWGLYGEGEFSLTKGYIYIFFINNCSQCWALYCLVVLYEATHEDLAPIKPFAKFVCVKGVVFFTFWQQSLLSTLAFFNVFTMNHRWNCYANMHEMINGIQDVLICFEMLVFAMAHAYAFPSREYRMRSDEGAADALRAVDGAPRGPVGHIRTLFDVSDVYEEVVNHVQGQTSTMAGAGVSVAAGISAYTSKGVKRGIRRLPFTRNIFANQDEEDPYACLLEGASSNAEEFTSDSELLDPVVS